MLGGIQGSYALPQRHQVSFSWRHFKSDRHYVGPHLQEQRTKTKSEFINRVHLVELGYRYTFNDRWSLGVNIPIQQANRNQPLRLDDPERTVVGRFDTDANGLGDITTTARRWMLRPDTHPYGNFSFGAGIKFPTGNEQTKDYRWRLVDGVPTMNDEPQFNDQSIQPGDGGYGFIGDFQWFQGIAKGRMTFYASAVYLFSPKVDSKAGHSASDNYLGRVGAIWTAPSWKGFAVGLGGRLEGAPWDDVINGNRGSRRPGYSISIEPSVSWIKGPHTALLSVPFMQYANRTRSASDRNRERGPGDAAFAPWSLAVGYAYRFGKPPVARKYENAAPTPEPEPTRAPASTSTPAPDHPDSETSALILAPCRPAGPTGHALQLTGGGGL